MAKTPTEVYVMVLEGLGRLADGQVAPASQTKKVRQKYEGLYDELLEDSLVNWGVDDDIPEFAVHPVVQLLLGMTADTFGVPDKWTASREFWRARLANSLASPYTPQPTRVDYF